MSKYVKLSSKLPGDPEINGLDGIAADLQHPDTVVCVLAWVVPSKVTLDLATGEKVPTVEVRRVEPIGEPDDVPQAVVDLAAELYEMRTGRNPLPFAELLSPAGDVDEVPERVESPGAAVKAQPRVSQDPAQIGEAYVFGDQDYES